MGNSFRSDVEAVFNLLKEHSEQHRKPKPETPLERRSGRATLTGGILVLAGEILRHASDLNVPLVGLSYLALSILGLLAFGGGVVASIFESVRTTRRPFVEHIDRITEALGGEYELIAALERFETDVLDFASKRLQLESNKVSSRVGVIGGGEGVRTSLVGVAMLGIALISQYESLLHGWSMKMLALLGAALLLGLSIGAFIARYGASLADYYTEIIGLALMRKAQALGRRSVFRRVGNVARGLPK